VAVLTLPLSWKTGGGIVADTLILFDVHLCGFVRCILLLRKNIVLWYSDPISDWRETGKRLQYAAALNFNFPFDNSIAGAGNFSTFNAEKTDCKTLLLVLIFVKSTSGARNHWR
jgi:hypothetical protein